MRALSIILAAATLLTTVSTAQAGTGSTEAQRATAQQMDHVAGIYRLSDGRRAKLYVLDGQLFLQIGRGREKEMLLAGPNQFTSRDGRITMQFGPELDTDHIVLAHDRAIAPPPDTIRLASNERAGRGSAN
jgi:hypothetical protein